MTAITDVDTANAWLERLEYHDAKRLGTNVKAARRAIAARIQAMPGTLENLRRFRLKNVPHWLMMKIRAEYAAALRREASNLAHEIHVAIQNNHDPRGLEVAPLRASLETIQTVLKEFPST